MLYSCLLLAQPFEFLLIWLLCQFLSIFWPQHFAVLSSWVTVKLMHFNLYFNAFQWSVSYFYPLFARLSEYLLIWLLCYFLSIFCSMRPHNISSYWSSMCMVSLLTSLNTRCISSKWWCWKLETILSCV